MRELSREAFEHDLYNSRRHRKDKRQKLERDAVEFVPILSPLGPKGIDLTGITFDPDSHGFMFQFGNQAENSAAALGETSLPEALPVDSDEYRKRILREEKTRRRFQRTITRKGKEIKTWGTHKHGAVSLVVTTPPWAMPILNEMEDDLRDALLLRLAHAAGMKMMEVAGRVPWGGGCHEDTDIAHFHFQVPKTAPDGKNWPKSAFKTGGAWLVGADRIEREFPGLLSPKQKEILEAHKAKKGTLVDLEIAAEIDRHLKTEFEEMGLNADYEIARKNYEKRKRKAQDTERHRGLLRSALRFFAVGGVWPLAAAVMDFAMWRLLPKQHRKLIVQSIRLTQSIAAPVTRTLVKTATLEILKKLKSLPEPVMTGPGR